MAPNTKRGEIDSIAPANTTIISIHADPVQPSGAGEAGGTHAYVRELLRGLAHECRYATVVTRQADPQLPAIQRLSDFTSIHRIRLGAPAPIDKRLLNSLHDETVEGIKDVIKRQSWPTNVLHGVYWNSGRAAMDLSNQLGIPFVQTVISNGKRRLKEGYLDNADNRIEIEMDIFHAATAVFCISNEERDDLAHLYGVDTSKLYVVGRPVPFSFRHPAQGSFGIPRSLHLDFDGTLDDH